MTLLEVPVLWPKCLNGPHLSLRFFFFFCLCVYFASLIEKDCLLFLWPQTKAEKCQVRDSWEPHVFLNDQLAAVGDGESKCKIREIIRYRDGDGERKGFLTTQKNISDHTAWAAEFSQFHLWLFSWCSSFFPLKSFKIKAQQQLHRSFLLCLLLYK